jgi:hypothetical protein
MSEEFLEGSHCARAAIITSLKRVDQNEQHRVMSKDASDVHDDLYAISSHRDGEA